MGVRSPPRREVYSAAVAAAGSTTQVVVLERGYEYDSCHFRSLTQVARAITGTHQSGLMFFGVRRRPRG